MSGLRAKHKADRQRRILEASSRLFRESGYDATRIEAIAALAEVSTGTIYNYYQNKGDILVAIVSMEVNEVLNTGRAIIARPPAAAETAIDSLIGGYLEHSLVYLSKEMWRQALAVSIQQPDSPFGRTYSGLDRALAEQVCDMIGKLQDTGQLSAGADRRSVGELIFNNMDRMFIEFVKSDGVSLAEFRVAIRRQNRIVINALSPPAAG